MIRFLLVLAALASPAAADVDRIVVGPVGADAALAGKITAAVPAKPIEAACANDTTCLAKVGTDEHAKVVVAIVVKATKPMIELELVLVDVSATELVGKRAVALPEAKLAQLPAAIAKFLDEGPIDRAKGLFTEGNEHYNLGEFAQALELYRRAYRIKPLPAFLFNIAQCHRKLNQHADAIAMYQSYLVGVPDASNRKLVEELIEESKTELAAQQAKASEDAKRDAERLDATKKAAEDARKAREAEALAASKRTEEARIEAERERAIYDRHPARKWALIGGGIGVGAVIAGGVFGLAARARQTAFDDAGCGDPARLLGEAALAQCRDDRDRGRRDATLSNIGFIAGGAIVAASAIVFVLDPGNVARPSRTALVVAPSSIGVAISW